MTTREWFRLSRGARYARTHSFDLDRFATAVIAGTPPASHVTFCDEGITIAFSRAWWMREDAIDRVRELSDEALGL